MEKYSNAGLNLAPYALSHADLVAVGRIIRACAEIEDIVSVHLCQMAEISEAQMIVLLGRMPLNTKISTAEKLAKGRGGAPWKAHQACFQIEAFKNLINCRNAVAHGILLGKKSDGRIVFRTMAATSMSPEAVGVRAATFLPEDLQAYANIAEDMIPQFEEILRTKLIREKRLE